MRGGNLGAALIRNECNNLKNYTRNYKVHLSTGGMKYGVPACENCVTGSWKFVEATNRDEFC